MRWTIGLVTLSVAAGAGCGGTSTAPPGYAGMGKDEAQSEILSTAGQADCVATSPSGRRSGR